MPLQKSQTMQALAKPRRNFSNTSTSTSASIKKAPASKIARLSPPTKTTLTGTSSSEAANAKPMSASNDSKPKVTIQRNLRLVSAKLVPQKAEKSPAHVLETPKASTFDSIKSFASKISRITPSRKSQSDSSTSRIASESLSHETRIPPPAAPQKAKTGYPNVSFMSGMTSLTFDTPKPQKVTLDKTTMGASKAHIIHHVVPKSSSTDGQQQLTLTTSQLGNSKAASDLVGPQKLQQYTLHTARINPTLDTIKTSSIETKNTIRIVSDPFDTQNAKRPTQVNLKNTLNTTKVTTSNTKSTSRIVSEPADAQKLKQPTQVDPVTTVKATTTKTTSGIASEPVRKQRLEKSTLHAATTLDVYKAGNTNTKNTIRIVSEPVDTQKLKQPAQVDLANALNTAKEQQHGASSAAEAKAFSIDSPVSTKSIDPSLFNITPINIGTLFQKKVGGLPNRDQSDEIRPSIEQDDDERKHIFSTRDWLNQKRRQFSSVQTPCPGDGTDDLMSLDGHGRTFPSVRKFTNKIGRIFPANRRERGGTLRYQTPEGGWKALSACPTTIGSSPSPYRMNLSPLSPGSCYVVRNSSQLELLNTINEYVAEAEKEREESRRRSDELADVAEELLILSEKEREGWLVKERELKARVEELEHEVAALKERVVAEKGEDHLGVQGANPLTGVWSDVEGAEAGMGTGRKGGKGKARGRWRRTESSWALGPSESSTGTVIRNPPDNPRAAEPSGIGSIIKNIHIHHHHHWRVARARRSS